MSETIKKMYRGNKMVIVDTEVTDIAAFKALGFSFEEPSDKEPLDKEPLDKKPVLEKVLKAKGK
jgi:hypothetical protein